MFLKINEFGQTIATPAPAPRRAAWPNAVHGLAGMAFLAAWLPVTLLCWAFFGTLVLMKFAVDAGRALGIFHSGG